MAALISLLMICVETKVEKIKKRSTHKTVVEALDESTDVHSLFHEAERGT